MSYIILSATICHRVERLSLNIGTDGTVLFHNFHSPHSALKILHTALFFAAASADAPLLRELIAAK